VKPTPHCSNTTVREVPGRGRQGVVLGFMRRACKHASRTWRDAVLPATMICPSRPGPIMPPGHVAAVPVGGLRGICYCIPH
jgi:hypothetical protein